MEEADEAEEAAVDAAELALEDTDVEGEDEPSPMIDIGVDTLGYDGYVEADDILDAAEEEIR